MAQFSRKKNNPLETNRHLQTRSIRVECKKKMRSFTRIYWLDYTALCGARHSNASEPLY